MKQWFRAFCCLCGWRSEVLSLTEEENTDFIDTIGCPDCSGDALDSFPVRMP